MFSDQQKIGLFLLTFAAFFIALGVLLLFDRGLLAFGNLLFFPGLALLVGVNNVRAYLIRSDKLHATICFFAGVALVLSGVAWIGFLVELMGFLSLFGNYFPYVWSVIKAFGTSIFVLVFGRDALPSSGGSAGGGSSKKTR